MVDYGGHTALIVVDIQNDFADPQGSLYVRGGEEVVERANREIQAAEAGGALVVYTQDWHPPVTPHFAKDGGIWPVHCVVGSWGAQLHPDLQVVGSAETVKVGAGGEDGYSGFSMRSVDTGEEHSTGLGDLLRARGIEGVVVVGLATDYCVKETALDALRLGFATTVVSDAVAAVDLGPGDGARALEELRTAGADVR
ncbi:MAG: isochorismatase family protein [Actinomycetota bacterium]|nr:isochorismatase family protein [Actinomycetota bacterium]